MTIRLGIDKAIVPHRELLPAATELAERVIRHSATAVHACLAAVTRGLNVPIDEGLAIEASWFAVTVPSTGVAEGLHRFLTRTRA